MQNNTIYLAIMTHGGNKFECKGKRICNKDLTDIRYERDYIPLPVLVPNNIKYVQHISHSPLGCYNFSNKQDIKGALQQLQKYIDIHLIILLRMAIIV